jgi:hypothetical protein
VFGTKASLLLRCLGYCRIPRRINICPFVDAAASSRRALDSSKRGSERAPATNRAENRAVSASVDLNDYGKGRASEEYNSIAKLEGREI